MNSPKKSPTFPQEMRRLAARPDRPFLCRYMPPALKLKNERTHPIRDKLKLIPLFIFPCHYLWKWESGLNYAQKEGGTIICDGRGMDDGALREAAAKLDAIFAEMKLIPVALLDSPDLSFFVRLGWLVEYLPKFKNDSAYQEKKLRYLALRYRGALFIPLAAGLGACESIKELVNTQGGAGR